MKMGKLNPLLIVEKYTKCGVSKTRTPDQKKKKPYSKAAAAQKAAVEGAVSHDESPLQNSTRGEGPGAYPVRGWLPRAWRA